MALTFSRAKRRSKYGWLSRRRSKMKTVALLRAAPKRSLVRISAVASVSTSAATPRVFSSEALL